MYVKYKLKNEKRIAVFLWDNIFNDNIVSDCTSYYPLRKDGLPEYYNECDLRVERNENNEWFFKIKDEIIKFNDFEFKTVDEWVEQLSLNKNNGHISYSDFFATFLKDTDNIGLLVKLREYEKRFKQFGLNITSSEGKQRECLCVPTERKYKKNKWYYQVTLEAADENLREDYAGELYYFEDLISLIKSGHITLVNRKDYELQSQHQKKKMKELLKKCFGK